MMFTIAAFYRFVALPEAAALCADATVPLAGAAAVDSEGAAGRPSPEGLRAELCAAFEEEELCGTMLIAPEGINGTLAGSAEVIERLLALLAERVGLERAEVKFAVSAERPFGRLKFLVKREIIAFRKAVVDPT